MRAKLRRQMTEHVEQVAAEHGVRLSWVPGWRTAHSYPGQWVAVVPTIKRPSDYLFCLHEIGHCVDPTAYKLRDATSHYDTLLCESAAWAWAVTTVAPRFLRSIRAEDWDRAAYGWRTYAAGDRWTRSGRPPWH